MLAMKLKSFFALIAMILFIQLFELKVGYCNNPTQIFSLDGNWDVTGYSPDRTKKINVDGTVPGQIHPDLQRAGLIPDPFWRDQAASAQWPEYYEWQYKKTFDMPEDFKQNWTVIQFDGLDTYSDIFLNGKKLGSTNHMFLPYEYEIN